jgi:hypothetical protein
MNALDLPQPTFFDLRPVVEVQHAENESLDSQFRAWLAANPHILDAFVILALQLQRAGRRQIGAKLIVERMRWEYAMQTTGDDFKLNNNYTSRLARAAVGRRPELESLFEFRELRS